MYSHALAQAQKIDRERAFGRESLRPERDRVPARAGLARIAGGLTPRPARAGRVDRYATPVAGQL